MYFETETFSRDTVSFCYKSGYTGEFLPIRVHKVRVQTINISQTSVSHSVHRGGGCLPACTGADTPLDRHPPPSAATAADGTHPTGMHFFCHNF